MKNATAKSRFSPWARSALAAVFLGLVASCGEGPIVFPGDDDDDDNTETVTVEGNIDDVSPVTSREIVVFVYNLVDSNDDPDNPSDPAVCPCPSDPSVAGASTQGKAAVVESGETEFSLTGIDTGPISLVFLLDEAGDSADGQIDPGDPIAVLDDVDCELEDVDSQITVTLKDVDLFFAPAPLADCETGTPPVSGRARADQITKARTSGSGD